MFASFRAAVMGLAVAGLLIAGEGQNAIAQEASDVASTIMASSSFRTAARVFQAAKLVDTLKSTGPFTAFVPNEAAFSKVPSWKLDRALRDQKLIAGISGYHIATGAGLTPSRLATVKALPTVHGKLLTVSMQGGTVVLDGRARVVNGGIVCTNGMVYEIDAVLNP